MKANRIALVDGDLVEQEVDGIVNAWNRNVFPWWLLLPQGVSASIKRKAGLAPFRELRRHGVLPLGGAVVTTAGELPLKAIIHVAGIGLTWRASERSIRLSVRNAIALASTHAIARLAFPLIGAGTGGFTEQESQRIMLDELGVVPFDGEARVVRFRPIAAHGQ
ncbi:MAG TPA: macro domain-containing protein [Polyangiaceae bacterium]|nr:macro domain-containing protein [Polyangiaceae bacterium]